MRSVQYHPTEKVDPFHLYLQLQDVIGQYQAFLLEAGREDDSSAYQTSLIGVCPILEVQVRNHEVTLTTIPTLEAIVLSLITGKTRMTTDVRWVSTTSGSSMIFHEPDPMAFLEVLRQALRETCAAEMQKPFSAGFLGYVGFDAIRYLERLPQTTDDDRELPDIRLQWHAGVVQLVDGSIAFYRQDDATLLAAQDNLSERLDAVERALVDVENRGLAEPDLSCAASAEPSSTPTIHYDLGEEAFCDNVSRAKEYIRAGDIFQVVLSTRIRIDGGIHPYVAYNRLRKLNPSPYMFVAEYPGMRLYGASPEVQFRSVAGLAEMKPIAGTTRGRGQSTEEDAALVAELKADAKENAEHVMLVDLCRNDLGRVAEIGSVHVPDFMTVERYSHLYHLVSRVEARLRPDVSVFHALLATFPNGTLSGAPKIRAMEIIDELERVRRGPYGGFIGMIDADANANTAIIIRSVVEIDGTQYVQAGAGVVLDSVPIREWEECHHKAGAILDVLTGAYEGRPT